MDKAQIIHNLYETCVLHNELSAAIETILDKCGFDPQETEHIATCCTDSLIDMELKPRLHEAIKTPEELTRLHYKSKTDPQNSDRAFDELRHDMRDLINFNSRAEAHEAGGGRYGWAQ